MYSVRMKDRDPQAFAVYGLGGLVTNMGRRWWCSSRGMARQGYRSRAQLHTRWGFIITVWAGSAGRLLCTAEATADFVYADFNFTHGLTFVGASATTACINVTELEYGFVHGDADEKKGSLDTVIHEEGKEVVSKDVRTSAVGEHEHIISSNAGFGNRQDAKQSDDAEGRRCRVRSRLTPSLPSKAGAMWYSNPVPVTRGFETLFTFQVSDHSRVCTEHMDPLFSARLHSTCSVQGGDGLAFVLHRDPRGVGAVGRAGADMGYGGLTDSLAVELDHRYNPPGDGSNDVFYDHVGIHSSGRGRSNSPLASSELAPPVVRELADGRHHLVKVKYFPRLATEYLGRFAATPNLVPYLKDNGEGRRLGTLVVWLDGGIADDEALVAMPINLSVLLDLPQDKAFVGFTAGTGRSWAKHDVMAWYLCHNDGGGRGQKGDTEEKGDYFDWKGCGDTPGFSTFRYGQSTEYHPESRLSRREAEPHGTGYGGGRVGDEATEVVAVPKGYWEVAAAGDNTQTPPETEY